MTIQEFLAEVQSRLQQVSTADVILWLGGALAAYVIGSISFAHIVSRAKGVDLRQEGSGNLGATNVYRSLGARAGLYVFLLDTLKGFLPAFAAWFLVGPSAELNYEGFFSFFNPAVDAWRDIAVAHHLGSNWRLLAIVYGVGAMVGHMFPFYLGFKGGKAVSTGCGVFLMLAPLQTFTSLLIWATVLMMTRYVSVASLTAAAFLVLQIWFATLNVKKAASMQSTLWFAAAVFVLVVYRHRGNIRRLFKGTENRLARPERRRTRAKTSRTSRPRRPSAASRKASQTDKAANPTRRVPAQEGYPGRRLPR